MATKETAVSFTHDDLVATLARVAGLQASSGHLAATFSYQDEDGVCRQASGIRCILRLTENLTTRG